MSNDNKGKSRFSTLTFTSVYEKMKVDFLKKTTQLKLVNHEGFSELIDKLKEGILNKYTSCTTTPKLNASIGAL